MSSDVVRGDETVADRAEQSDASLVEATRAGNPNAYGELWRRHYQSAVSAARAITSKFDPDDIAQESFAAIFNAIINGGGPTSGFRAYLLTAVRNTAAGWGRSRREIADDQLDTKVDPDWNDAQTEEELDRSLTATAFRSLPSRWQEVLWYTEIERMRPAAVAPLLGMKPVAVAQLAFRAREGLREAWIQAHLRSLSDDSECKWVVERLGAYARKNSSKRDATRIDAHLLGCARCMIVLDEAGHVSSRLALVMLPLTIGAVGAGGYLASIQGSPVSGAVAMGETGAPTGATGTSGAGGAGGAIGAGGASSGGLGVAGVVAGGTAVASAATLVGSGEAAAAAGFAFMSGAKVSLLLAAATAAVAIAGTMTVLAATRDAGEPLAAVVLTDEEHDGPAQDTSIIEVPPTREPTVSPQPETHAAKPSPPLPAVVPEVALPVDPVDPVSPGDPGTAPVDPGTGPGTGTGPVDPGTGPGTGTGPVDPGTGPVDPGTGPGTGTGTGPGTGPVDGSPTETAVVGGYTAFALDDGEAIIAMYIVMFIAVPEGMDVQVTLDGVMQQAAPNALGFAAVTIVPTAEQLADPNTSVLLNFVNEHGTGPVSTIPLTYFQPSAP